MNLLDLVVKIGVDDKATSKVAAIGDSIKGGLGTAAKAGVAALGAALASAATGTVALGKAALESYAQYEQLVGGVDKLFQDASPKLQEYAANAYQTAGMSANQYMEQATSFSAALINSLGGDTQKAADMADVAMRAMSDNVNTFGSSMEDVQNAFQGFSKQNFTMLDNLKLGYGGTKQEMQRLISDANEYAASIGEASDLSIDSFSDIVTAIDLIQQKQGIAGTTAREAATTIEGSVNMAKAAWQNWVTELGKDNADMGKLTTQLVDSVTKAASNIVPRIAVIAGAAMAALSEQLPSAVEQIGASLSGYAPTLGESVMSLIGTVAQMAMEYAPTALLAIVGAITAFLTEYAPTLLQAAMTMFLAIVQAIIDSGPQIMDALMVVLQSLVQVCINNMPAMASAAHDLIWMLLQAIVDYGPAILQQLLLLLASLIVAIGMAVGQFFDQGVAVIQGLWDGAMEAFQSVADWFGSIGDMILGAVGDLGSLLVGSGEALLNGLKDGVMNALGGVTDSISQALEGIRALFPFSPAKKGPFSGHGYTTYSGRALMDDFGGAIVATAPKVAARAASAMSAVHDALGAAALGVPTSVGVGVGSVCTARAAVGAAPAEYGSSSDQVIAWLAENLPSIIEEFTPVMGESEFGRKARKAVAYA